MFVGLGHALDAVNAALSGVQGWRAAEVWRLFGIFRLFGVTLDLCLDALQGGGPQSLMVMDAPSQARVASTPQSCEFSC